MSAGKVTQRESDLSTESIKSDRDLDFPFGNRVLIPEISYQDFERWTLDSGIDNCKYWYINGSVLITEATISASHSKASRFFCHSIDAYNVQLSGNTFGPLSGEGDQNRKLIKSSKQPDESFTVDDRRCPNLVVEVAVSQNLMSLHTACSNYILQSKNIMAAIGIKIFDYQLVSGTIIRPMAAFLYLRIPNVATGQQPYEIANAISFGNVEISEDGIRELMAIIMPNAPAIIGVGIGDYPPCDRIQQEPYLLRVPCSHLLCRSNTADIAEVPEEYRYPWVIDLYVLQQRILSGTERDMSGE